jgi:hypothetical protein
LMAIWMNVVHAVVAHWLFFFCRAIAHTMCMTQPLSRCGVAGNPCVLDRRSCTVVVSTPTVYPLLPRIGEGNRLHVAGAPTSPLSVVGLANSLQGCQPWPVTSLGGFWSSIGRSRFLPCLLW